MTTSERTDALVSGVRSPRALVAATGAVNVINVHGYLLALLEAGIDVRVALTRNARRMVKQRPLRAIVGHAIYSDSRTDGLAVPHVNLASWSDIILVLPATANILAKAAAGIGDDLVSTTLLSASSPIIFVPSMNGVMWSNAAVQRAVRVLENDGRLVLRCASPRTIRECASGERVASELMPEPREVLAAIERALYASGRVAPALGEAGIG